MAENFFNISSFVDDLVPEHIATDYPELIEFMKVYCLYLEHSNKSGFYLNQLDHQRDIDLIEAELLQELQNEIGIPIPRSFAASPRLFYRHLVEFYKSRGTPESITSFFKLIYDDDVEIYYPKEDMLIPSDGKWISQAASIVDDHTKHTPTYTFDITTPTSRVEGADNRGFSLKIDDDIVFVNGVHVPTKEWKGGFYQNEDYSEFINYIDFTQRELIVGDTVKVYKSGLYTTADGFASDKKFIQDSFFYQKFSYVLKTGKNITDWKSAFTRLIHPAGFMFFGEILIFIEMLKSESAVGAHWISNAFNKYGTIQPGYQKDGLPRNVYIDMVSSNPYAIALQEIISALGASRTISKYTWGMDEGTYVEKELLYDTIVLATSGFKDHFNNTKFVNFRPINDYGHITFEDVINKTIGNTQLGCVITAT